VWGILREHCVWYQQASGEGKVSQAGWWLVSTRGFPCQVSQAVFFARFLPKRSRLDTNQEGLLKNFLHIEKVKLIRLLRVVSGILWC
jgi:hypothetical protein